MAAYAAMTVLMLYNFTSDGRYEHPNPIHVMAAKAAIHASLRLPCQRWRPALRSGVASAKKKANKIYRMIFSELRASAMPFNVSRPLVS
jgi:hypothetical protein